MTIKQVEFEGHEITELLARIEECQLLLAKNRGINWHDLSYFSDSESGFWRFDWEYRWDDTDTNLETLLTKAISWADKELE